MHYCIQKLRWTPQTWLDMDEYQKAFVVASIKTKLESEKKNKAELDRAKRKGRK